MARRAPLARPRRSPRRTGNGRTAAAAAGRFARLVATVQQLRGPNGCPWDREQTLRSLRPFVLEETYEVLDAIDRNDPDALCDEIGDLLFEGVFLAQICAEAGQFSIADAVEAITAKLVRRHPHVFGTTTSRRARRREDDTTTTRRARRREDDATTTRRARRDEGGTAETRSAPEPEAGRASDARGIVSSRQVLEQWEAIKARERRSGSDAGALLRGVSATLPALLRAYEIGTRVAAVGFDWARAGDVVAKIEEEVAELRRALPEGGTRTEEEMGDLLFSIANLARKLGIDPESALRQANEKFARRFAELERRLHARGISLQDATLEQMEAAWMELKEGAG